MRGDRLRDSGEIAGGRRQRVSGGGTPSILAPDLLRRLFAALHAEFDVTEKAEITMECAPGQIEEKLLSTANKLYFPKTPLTLFN